MLIFFLQNQDLKKIMGKNNANKIMLFSKNNNAIL